MPLENIKKIFSKKYAPRYIPLFIIAVALGPYIGSVVTCMFLVKGVGSCFYLGGADSIMLKFSYIIGVPAAIQYYIVIFLCLHNKKALSINSLALIVGVMSLPGFIPAIVFVFMGDVPISTIIYYLAWGYVSVFIPITICFLLAAKFYPQKNNASKELEGGNNEAELGETMQRSE